MRKRERVRVTIYNGVREEKELQLGVAVGITWAFFASRGPPFSFFFFFFLGGNIIKVFYFNFYKIVFLFICYWEIILL